jgi:oxygen-dependent protoporphyrinogen oxidase
MTQGDPEMQRVEHRGIIVVGGGISGLVAAWKLKSVGADVALVESNNRVGGCMRSEHRDGFILEKGPFNVLVRDEAFHDLLDACEGDVKPIRASEDSNARWLLKNGRLHAVPTGPPALIGSPLLSVGAKLRMLRGMLIGRRADTDEPTIHQAAERRLGREVADTFISSIVAGVFGGDSRKLSLKACFPKAWRFDRERRSPLLYEMKVLREKKRRMHADSRLAARNGLISFDGGLQSLADWLAAQLGDGLLARTRVESIEQTDDGYVLRCSRGAERITTTCRHLVLATPAPATADLLRALAPRASETLEQIETASLVVLNLGYRKADIGHPMRGYGFLVPSTETDVPIMGVLWADSAFPHHAPPDQRLIRIFMGGPRDPGAAQCNNDELLRRGIDAVKDLLSITGEPSLVDICRWPNSIPQYHLGHPDRVEAIRAGIANLPGLHLVGSYLTGVSVNDCVRDATRIVDEIIHTDQKSVSSCARSRPPSAADRRTAIGPNTMKPRPARV